MSTTSCGSRSRTSSGPSSRTRTTRDVADAVLVWFRQGDDDLVDTLVDSLTNLADGGFVVLLSPKAGHPDHVDASEIEEAAVTAGLHTAGGANVSAEWSSVRLVAPRGARRCGRPAPGLARRYISRSVHPARPGGCAHAVTVARVRVAPARLAGCPHDPPDPRTRRTARRR